MSGPRDGGTAARFCPFCGATAVAGGGFCAGCGRPLLATGAAPEGPPAAPAPSPPVPAGRVSRGSGAVLIPLAVAALVGIAAFAGTTAALGGGPLGSQIGSDPPHIDLSTDGGGSLPVNPPATPGPIVSTTPTVPVASPTAAEASPAPSPGTTPGPSATPSPTTPPTPSPTPSPTPTPDAATAWFTDDLAAVGYWPVGKQDLLTTVYGGGRFLVTARATNYPLYVWATLQGPGATATLEATFRSSAPRTWYGLSVVDETGAPIVSALVDGTGAYALHADHTESLETRAQGHTDAFRPGRANRLALHLTTRQIVLYVNGVNVAQANVSTAAARFGIAVQAEKDGARISVDDYRVWTAP